MKRAHQVDRPDLAALRKSGVTRAKTLDEYADEVARANANNYMKYREYIPSLNSKGLNTENLNELMEKVTVDKNNNFIDLKSGTVGESDKNLGTVMMAYKDQNSFSKYEEFLDVHANKNVDELS
jgi:hypothetical protein